MSDARPPTHLAVGDLIIRRWRLSDLDVLVRAIEESVTELRPWLGWAEGDARAQGEFLAATALAWERGERFEYAVENRSGEFRASVGLMRRIGPGGLEIGYWVHSEHTGRGIAKLAAARLTAAAFDLAWVDHVEIHHDLANARSGAVPAGLGFRMVEESAAEGPSAPGESGRDLIWRLLREEYPASATHALLVAADAMAGP